MMLNLPKPFATSITWQAAIIPLHQSAWSLPYMSRSSTLERGCCFLTSFILFRVCSHSSPCESTLLSLHWLHRGEEQYITNGCIIRHQHHHAVDDNDQTSRGRHAVFKGVSVSFDVNWAAAARYAHYQRLKSKALFHPPVQHSSRLRLELHQSHQLRRCA